MIDPMVAQALERARAGATAVAGEWGVSLTAEDRRALVWAFHRAEALAAVALEQAAAQVPRRYREELLEQLEDERRHVALFAEWLGDEPEVAAPAERERPWQHWFAALLLNELTGFCQFHLLATLVEGERRAAVLAAVADEEAHVERLVGWLRGAQGDLRRSVRRFCRALDGLMRQFFPREELGGVRAALGAVVERLLAEVAAAA